MAAGATYNICLVGTSSNNYYRIGEFKMSNCVFDTTCYLNSAMPVIAAAFADACTLSNVNISVRGSGGSGMQVISNATNAVVKNCSIRGSLLYNFHLQGRTTGASKFFVSNCISKTTNANGIGLYLQRASGTMNYAINDNIIYDCAANGAYGIYKNGTMGADTVEDYNDIYNCKTPGNVGAHDFNVDPAFIALPNSVTQRSINNAGWIKNSEAPVNEPPLYRVKYLGGIWMTATDSLDGLTTGTGNNYNCTSLDGIRWQYHKLPTGLACLGLAYGDGKWIMSTMTDSVFVSTDSGNTWTGYSCGLNKHIHSLSYGNGRFVGVADNAESCAVLLNGSTTWNKYRMTGANSDNNAFHASFFGCSLFVAFAGNKYASNNVERSYDGITWYNSTAPALAWIDGFAKGNVLFEYAQAAINNTMVHSLDSGKTWIPDTTGADSCWLHAGVGGDTNYVVLGYKGTNQEFRSTTGVGSWTAQAGIPAQQWVSMDYKSPMYVASGVTGAKKLIRSIDGGTTWLVDSIPDPILHLSYGIFRDNLVTTAASLKAHGSQTCAQAGLDTSYQSQNGYRHLRTDTITPGIIYDLNNFSRFTVTMTNSTPAGTLSPSTGYLDSGVVTTLSYTPPTGYAKTAYASTGGVVFNADSTSFYLTANGTITATCVPDAPVITAQPSGITVNDYSIGFDSVTATGTGTITYQWYKNITGSWVAMAGKTARVLSYTGAYADSGYYIRAIVTDSYGSTTSDSAELTVNPIAPVITVQPSSARKAKGQSAMFTTSARGTATIAYKWIHGSDSVGAGLTYTTVALDSSWSGDTIRSIATNDFGTDTSNAAIIYIVNSFGKKVLHKFFGFRF